MPERRLRLRIACLALALVWTAAICSDPSRSAPLPPPPAAVGYRRLSRDDVVAHDVRRALLARIQEAPGITVGALAARENLDYKTVSHHARVLKEFRMVEHRSDGRFQRLFPAGGYAHPMRPLHEAAGTATVTAMLRLLAAEPGMPPVSVARRLGVAKSTVKWHMDRLVERGLLLATPQAGGGLSLTVHPRFLPAALQLGDPAWGTPAS